MENAEAVVTQSINAAVEEVLSSMFSIKATRGQMRSVTDPKIAADVSGIINLSQNQAGGLLVVSFPKKLALHLLSNAYGRPFTAVDASVTMAIGELTNVIYCVAKKTLNEEGHAFGMAIPSIIVGNQQFVFSHFRGQIHIQEFETEFGNFQVYTCMERALARPNQAA